jgi:hypothetical protein
LAPPALLPAAAGDPLPATVSRAIVVARLASLMQGRSGIRAEALTLLADLLNAGRSALSTSSPPGKGSIWHLIAWCALCSIGYEPVFHPGFVDAELVSLVTGCVEFPPELGKRRRPFLPPPAPPASQ